MGLECVCMSVCVGGGSAGYKLGCECIRVCAWASQR